MTKTLKDKISDKLVNAFLTNKIISTGLKNRSNAYVKDCPLK